MEQTRKTYKQLTSSGATPAQREAWVESASKSELVAVMKANASHTPEYLLAEKMLLIRLAEPKPHWTTTPAFWIAVAAMVFAAIAAWPVVQGWLHI